jgi:hypothetical protein
MADETYYAWSFIKVADKDGNIERIKPGTEVTEESLGTTDEHWDELLESGAVRSSEWPGGLSPDNPNAYSPNEYRLMKLRQDREKLEEEMAGVGGEQPTPAGTTTSSSASSSSEPK